MKRTIIIIVLSILGLLILTGEKCSDEKNQTEQNEAIENEDEDEVEMKNEDEEMESDTLDPDTLGLGMTELDEDAIGGADYNFLEAWEMSEVKNHKRTIKLLNSTESKLLLFDLCLNTLD